ncbi:MAG: selenocysteine-specific translation elongation factor [Armatimonadota bacterium]|nr:selenocysteine-specific translation elongation factor [Armatimonadota bacterium]MDR7453377.1 selenocysteine-specific translation elongation factor [Armatimonadota bacterium]MDR7457196.1 selenocysteine-specific translation elongation factor [Armatimonadota bacterium]MDR7496063.1 selenocysteine-specific translation elongation factor [Armatimonadota bacterium]MDR7512047.1 selenocysteine-specific translation elongation factor [Armatimonadota bacterium]
MRAVTIGTAGHIDHGKSALVRALTGIDPDRLAEEQRRGMTLDLGFAHLDLPGGIRAGIVDVPGHEALVHNMLAGAGGIDVVILVVAADEGVMPQTREHLDILGFLGLAGGVVALTKVDLVGDEAWLAAVEDDVRAHLAGTPLEGAPVVRVSARTGVGLPDLVAALDRLVAAVPPRPADGPVRLPADRVFTMQGFGTVVTGTLWSGTVRPGQTLVVLPLGLEARVRGVQVHGAAVSEAMAGSRVAVNLAGVEKSQVARGDVLATPGAFRPADRLDVRLRLVAGAPALRHGDRVHLHLGSGASVARVLVAGGGRIEPGQEGDAQLRVSVPTVAIHGDRFVIRRYSPTRTIGGGVVHAAGVGTSTGRRPRAAGADAAAVLVAAVAARAQEGVALADLAAVAGLEAGTAGRALDDALTDGRLVRIGDRVYARSVADALRAATVDALQAYHEATPWRAGMPREALRSRVLRGAHDALFETVLAEMLDTGEVAAHRRLIARRGFQPRRTEEEASALDALRAAVERGGISPPPLDELRRLAQPDIADRMLQVLLDEGAVVAVAPDLRYAASVVAAVQTIIVETLRAGGEVTVATLRDRLGTSRRYALALLEYFDASRVTRRVGDRRILGPQAGAPRAPAG